MPVTTVIYLRPKLPNDFRTQNAQQYGIENIVFRCAHVGTAKVNSVYNNCLMEKKKLRIYLIINQIVITI